MRKLRVTMLVLALGFFSVSNGMAGTDGQTATGKAAVQAGRIAVGTAIGGQVGKVVVGSPAGAAVGTFLTPSQTSCFTGETCARGATVIDPKTGNRSTAK